MHKRGMAVLLAFVTLFSVFAASVDTIAEETEPGASTQQQESETVVETTTQDWESENKTTTEESASEDIRELAKGYAPGDVDLNGKVNAADARILLRGAVGLEVFTPLQRLVGDIDESGCIDATDARGALRISVGFQPFETLPHDKKEEKTEPVTEPIPKTLTVEERVINFANAVDAERLFQSIDALTDCPGRYMGSQQATNAFSFIKKQLISYGYAESSLILQAVSLSTSSGTRNGYNIVIKIPAKTSGAGILTVSAHYDAVPAGRGSVDNGSGVSSLLEVARILKKQTEGFAYEIHICFFTGEENGYLGAYRYLANLTQNEKSRLKQVLNLDMTAHFKGEQGNYLCVSTEPYGLSSYAYRAATNNLGSLAVTKTRSQLGGCKETAYYCPVSTGYHDIVPFRKQGISAVTLSWREKQAGSGGDYDLIAPARIHTAADMLQNTDLESLTLTTRLIAGTVARLLYE